MENKLILLDTIKTLCHGISQQQTFFENDQLINPLLPNVDNPGNPVVPNVDNPEPVTLYHGASRKLRAASIRILMNQHHFPLPQNWTYEQLADEIIGQPVDLVHLLDIFQDLTTFGFASQPFHQLLDFLHTVD